MSVCRIVVGEGLKESCVCVLTYAVCVHALSVSGDFCERERERERERLEPLRERERERISFSNKTTEAD